MQENFNRDFDEEVIQQPDRFVTVKFLFQAIFKGQAQTFSNQLKLFQLMYELNKMPSDVNSSSSW